MIIDIVGAGIGGLTNAIALQQKGFTVRVFEQAEKIKAVGAGIILANNAMQIYRKLGLEKIIVPKGNPISAMHIATAQLKPLSTIDLAYFEDLHGVQNIAIQRGILQKILMDNLKPGTLYLGYKLLKAHKNTEGHMLEFKNGKKIQSQILIGADGINSVVRQNLFSHTKIRKANQICWRGLVDFTLPQKYQTELNEAWGKEDRFGFVQIAKNKVYWYALKSFQKDKEEFDVRYIDVYFEAYNAIIKDILSKTKKDQVFTAEILDLKPFNNWYKDNVCLLGDAAHAMTPNMGQGACQAIEDAYALAFCLDTYETKKAFEEFVRLRQPKANKIVKTSWQLGKIAHLSNPFLIHFRNLLMQWAPSKISRKQSEQLFQIANI